MARFRVALLSLIATLASCAPQYQAPTGTAATPAVSPGWRIIEGAAGGAAVDMASIEGSGNRRWALVMYADGDRTSGIGSMVVYHEIDCGKRQLRSIRGIAYSGILEGRETPVPLDGPYGPMAQAAPGTVADGVVTVACSA
jgi:hypothetical protein